jgi:hypothetical protein
MVCSRVNLMGFSQVETLKLYMIKWQEVIILLVYSFIESKLLCVLCITQLFYYCVYQNHRLEHICCYLCLELGILVWILREWWCCQDDCHQHNHHHHPQQYRLKTKDSDHILPNVLNSVCPIPWLPLPALMTCSGTALPFFWLSHIIEM